MLLLLISALSIGLSHTLLGPDHYLPFIVLAKSRQWSMLKTIVITLLCGVGHVLSAVVLGLAAIAIGLTLSRFGVVESLRGEVAAWLLIGFGFIYFVWGIHNIVKNKGHQHSLAEEHHSKRNWSELTPWVLFIIFILGPCEPLVPLIMYPAIQESFLNTVWVVLCFGVGTLSAMLFMVITALYGANKLIKVSLFERYGNAMAGMVVCGCGLAIKFLGV